MTPLRSMIGAALALGALLATGAPASAQPSKAKTLETKTLEVVASFTVVADMVRQVGGEHVRVTSLVGPNGDPHEYEPTPDDARTLKRADVVVMSGLGFEHWFGRLARASGYKGEPVVASNGIKPLTMKHDGRTVADPHAWNSPANGEVYVRNIAAALAKADPEDAPAFEANAKAYLAKLKDLDAYARAQIDAIPAGDRKVLTTHEALGYFGAAYGVRFLSPLGLSTEKEPSAADVARVIRQIKAEGVRTYFFENASDARLTRQIADATGAQRGGALYVESLSGPEGPAATYEAMFRHNVDTLVAGMKAARRS